MSKKKDTRTGGSVWRLGEGKRTKWRGIASRVGFRKVMAGVTAIGRFIITSCRAIGIDDCPEVLAVLGWVARRVIFHDGRGWLTLLGSTR